MYKTAFHVQVYKSIIAVNDIPALGSRAPLGPHILVTLLFIYLMYSDVADVEMLLL